MTPPPVVVFTMIERGHFQRLLPLISGLSRRGLPVHVFTDSRFEAATEAAGGTFVDLFGPHPLEAADDESVPFPCRYVTYAEMYADPVIEQLRALGPSLVIYDTFAVIGRVAALALDIPNVNVCAGHNADPARTVPALRARRGLHVADACLDAVAALAKRPGLGNASPFSYIDGLSPHLNVYCEPPPFLTESERRPFEPIAFHGSLAGFDELDARDRAAGEPPFGEDAAGLNVYVSFGTVVWRHWAPEALDAMAAIGSALSSVDDARAIVSLGGADVDPAAVDAIAQPNVRVERWVDQWRVLRDTHVFVTHQGLNSTHEAIYNEVPMISYPFANDQPALAERCRELGLATPLTEAPLAPLTPKAVVASLGEVAAGREAMAERLAEARAWERDAIAGRETVLDRITALAAA